MSTRFTSRKKPQKPGEQMEVLILIRSKMLVIITTFLKSIGQELNKYIYREKLKRSGHTFLINKKLKSLTKREAILRTLQEANRIVHKTNSTVLKANLTVHKANRTVHKANRTKP